MTGDDRDLRDLFASLRAEEESSAPDLEDLLRRQPVRGRSKSAGRLIAAGALLAAAIAAVVWLLPEIEKPHGYRERPVAFITQWKSPTDFLLDTPGRDLLQTVPSVGAEHEYEFAPHPTQKHLHPRTQKNPLKEERP